MHNKFSEFVRYCDGVVDIAEKPLPDVFTYINSNTRSARGPGWIYVAGRGPNFDGHQFVSRAAETGAVAAVVRNDYIRGKDDRIPLIRVDDPHKAVIRAAAKCRAQLSCKVIGIVGSAGKTTTRELLSAFLRGKFRVYENPENDCCAYTVFFVPDDAEYFVCEMGISRPGVMQDYVTALRPSVAIVTSIGTAHIGVFGSQECITREKGKVLEGIAGEDGEFVVLSRENTKFEFLKQLSNAPVVEVSMSDATAPFFGTVVDVNKGELVVRENPTEKVAHFEINIPGRHTCSNALLAYACARRLGVSYEDCLRGMVNFCVPGARWRRMEWNGISFIDDSFNANSVSMMAVLDNLSSMATGGGRKVAVLGDMMELGEYAEELHREVGRYAAGKDVDIFLTVGRMASTWLADEISSGSNKVVFRAANAVGAKKVLLKMVRSGDVVLLKASHGVGLSGILRGLED